MNLHNQIMNIQVDKEVIDCLDAKEAKAAYKVGHRDARHAAAELSLKYERYIEKLEAVYENWPIISKIRKEVGLV